VDAAITLGQQYFYRIKTTDVHGNESVSSSQLTADVPLSAEITSFTVVANHFTAQLHWNTATETNNHGFEIERKIISNEQLSSSNWIKTGFVEGNGTTNSSKNYSYSESNIIAGKYEYRLKQISNDGNFTHSHSVEVEIGIAPKLFELSQNYPNPSNPTTNIEFTVPANGLTTLKVFNAIGQEVATLFNGEAEAGKYNLVTFDAKDLSSGIYFARLVSDRKSQIKKLLFVK
jgi:hypothetical protein